MKKWIYVVMFIIGGALSAFLGLPVLGIYSGLWAIGLLVWWLIRIVKNFPKKAFNKVNHVAQKRLEKESNGEPYVTTHHGPEGLKGLEIGFDDEEDGQPGAGKFNPSEVTRDLLQMRTAEAQAKTADTIHHVLTDDIPYYLKEIALNQLTPKPVTETGKSPKQNRIRQRKRGDDFVGLSEGNYSIE